MGATLVSKLVGGWRLYDLPLWECTRQVLRGFRRHHLDARSAQFAYYWMLLIAPSLVLLLWAASHLPLKGLLDTFLASTQAALPSGAYDIVVGQIEGIQNGTAAGFIWASAGVFLYAGTQLFGTLVRGLNASYGTTDRRRMWEVYGISLVLNVAALVLLLSALVLLVAGPLLSDRLLELVSSDLVDSALVAVLINRGSRWAIVLLFVLLSTSTIYWMAPAARTSWHLLSPGSVCATLGWAALSMGFRYYVAHFARYNETYGALGGVITLMVWLYLTGTMLLLGGQVNAVLFQAELRAAATNL